MSTITKSGFVRILGKLSLIVVCAFCLQLLCSCSSKSGEEGLVDHVIKYASARTMLDAAESSVVWTIPDAKVEVSLLSVEESPSGVREIELEPTVVSNTMASWSADEWAANRDDLYFNFAAHFKVICKQAHKYGDIPQEYAVICPDYMVVYDSQRNTGFVVSSTGVYHKTDDPENPIGEAIVLA